MVVGTAHSGPNNRTIDGYEGPEAPLYMVRRERENGIGNQHPGAGNEHMRKSTNSRVINLRKAMEGGSIVAWGIAIGTGKAGRHRQDTMSRRRIEPTTARRME